MNKIIYLDAAASYLKPDVVIDTQVDYLRNNYANAGRGVCGRAKFTDNMITDARNQIAKFMNANANQIVFTSGTTDAMNMIAKMLKLSGDKIVAVSDLDHHSARLPFVETGAKIVLCPLNSDFNIDISDVPYSDVLVITAMSNVLGVSQDVAEIIRAAREKNPNVITVVDAAQFVVHENIDVTKWDCDFVCWSGHKIGADTGIGVMYIKNPDSFSPVKFGGGMVLKVENNNVVLNSAPDVFEAGTLPLTQISGMGAAIQYLQSHRPDMNLIKYLYDELSDMPMIKMLSCRDSSLCSFVIDGMHVLDFGTLLGACGVCVRVGNMCASWIHAAMGISGSVRISVGAYNTKEEIETVIKYIKDILK